MPLSIPRSVSGYRKGKLGRTDSRQGLQRRRQRRLDHPMTRIMTSHLRMMSVTPIGRHSKMSKCFYWVRSPLVPRLCEVDNERVNTNWLRMKGVCIISNRGQLTSFSASLVYPRCSHAYRPGWKEFLRETATKYEMHVYTMGTRAYAEEVCAAIDPDGSIFGGRLLSRDESGSKFLGS